LFFLIVIGQGPEIRSLAGSVCASFSRDSLPVSAAAESADCHVC